MKALDSEQAKKVLGGVGGGTGGVELPPRREAVESTSIYYSVEPINE
ncbi:hypothetical protein [Pseudoalteromonas galatheae]